MAGQATSARKATEAVMAKVSNSARVSGRSRATKAVMRMCSPRRSATTAPSIDSHRNRIEASSSDHTSGAWKA